MKGIVPPGSYTLAGHDMGFGDINEEKVNHPAHYNAGRIEAIDAIEDWTMTLDKFEVMKKCNPLNIPCGPILSMKELAEEPSLRDTGTVVEVDHPERGKYLTVGNPVKLSESISEVKRSPLLGEHTEEILKTVLGLTDEEISKAREEGAI